MGATFTELLLSQGGEYACSSVVRAMICDQIPALEYQWKWTASVHVNDKSDDHCVSIYMHSIEVDTCSIFLTFWFNELPDT